MRRIVYETNSKLSTKENLMNVNHLLNHPMEENVLQLPIGEDIINDIAREIMME